MAEVHVMGVRTFAYHGCMKEEAKIGTWFETDVKLTANLSQAAVSDDLTQTIDYVTVAEIVQAEMAQRADLIEHVAKRILARCKSEWSYAEKVRVEVRKYNAPMQAEVGHVAVVFEG